MRTGRLLALSAVCLAAGAATATDARAQVVRGVIRDAASGRPLPAVTVGLLTSGDSVVRVAASDDSGRFVLAAPAAGRYVLAVRRIGLQPRTEGPIELATGDTTEVALRMEPAGYALDTVRVEARRKLFGVTPGHEQFARRAREGRGLFISGREIEWSRLPIAEFIGRLPGFQYTPAFRGRSGLRTENGGVVSALAGVNGCIRMRVDRLGFVTGMNDHQMRVQPPVRYTPRGTIRPAALFIDLETVIGVEVYRTREEVPKEFRFEAGRCALIQVWTTAAW